MTGQCAASRVEFLALFECRILAAFDGGVVLLRELRGAPSNYRHRRFGFLH